MSPSWKDWKNKNSNKMGGGKASPIDFIKKDTEYATDEVAASRMEICEGCEFLIPLTKQCRKCGCFMKLKTKLSHAQCPIGKW